MVMIWLFFMSSHEIDGKGRQIPGVLCVRIYIALRLLFVSVNSILYKVCIGLL